MRNIQVLILLMSDLKELNRLNSSILKNISMKNEENNNRLIC